ncbi:MAG: alpha/beta hydrolase [Myxococcales bacterium]|jgi:pimeloyl-ACP methyl ester carboxylesterase|nr:alpha/beta hydrolase [Myxococcales bacterium]
MSTPVAVFPGFSAGDLSTFVIRRYLQNAGYRVHRWRLGVNGGRVPMLIPKVVSRTESLFARYGEPVSLVGWSLGGVLAREVARERPEIVKSVVTLGSPVIGGPKYTRAAKFYEQVLREDLDAIEQAVEERNQIPISVPLTAIYSRRDAVVKWEACIDHYNPHCEHIEVDASHLSLGFDPRVLQVVRRAIEEAGAPESIHVDAS